MTARSGCTHPLSDCSFPVGESIEKQYNSARSRLSEAVFSFPHSGRPAAGTDATLIDNVRG